jgi:hypothetical protein
MKRMKMTSLLLSCWFITTLFSTTVFALTTEHEVTLTYVRDHPKEFSVVVAKKAGLIDFTIKHDVARPMYHVAHLAIYHQGKLLATSDTPSFGKKQGNVFHFSIAAEDVPESKFDLSDSALAGSGDDAVPVPGTTVHQFRLLDFVPNEMLKSTPNK